jgi:hypothetical protein
VFEGRVLRKIFEPKRCYVKEAGENFLANAELHELQANSSPNRPMVRTAK